MAARNDILFRVARRRSSVRRARNLLHAVAGDWSIGQETLAEAELVLSELVTNALRVPVPGDRLVEVRIARLPEDGVLRLEVGDAGGGKPEVRTPSEDETGGRGLLLVDALAHRWGYEPRPSGIGKTVWAELKTPDIAPEPEATEVAAITVRAGQRVRVRGKWYTVRGLHAERHASDSEAHVVLHLDDGPGLRITADSPLTVQADPPPRSGDGAWRDAPRRK
ncbi:ATP-binding protein [Streptomyces sp. NPDC004749]